MRALILSDIHGNLEALNAVLAAAEPYDALWNLGDVVGYGASPNEVIDLMRAKAQINVRGNHDRVGAGLTSALGFNPVARQAFEARLPKRRLIQIVGPRLALPLEDQAAPLNFLADLHHATEPERKHRIPEQNILDPQVLHEVLDFVHNVARRAEAPEVASARRRERDRRLRSRRRARPGEAADDRSPRAEEELTN